jgi:hypothetical protein
MDLMRDVSLVIFGLSIMENLLAYISADILCEKSIDYGVST